MRLAPIVALALVTALTSTASAQRRPKRPKKPKTERPKHDKTEERIPETSDREQPQRASEPEPEPEKPAANPWAASGTTAHRDEAQAAPRSAPDWVSRPILVGAYGGYASENYRIGFGGRAGYAFRDTFYVGAAFTYQLGVVIADIKYSGYYPAAEGGYDWHFSGFTLRPYLGVGLFFARTSGPTETETGGGWFSFYPGLSLDYQIASTPAFLGLDSRVLLVLGAPGGRDPSLGVFAVGGVRF